MLISSLRFHRQISMFDYHSLTVADGQFVDLRIGGAIGIRQIQGVDRVVSHVAQSVRQSTGKLRVNQEVQVRIGSVRLT